jgi:hypothetical protein
MVSFITNDAYGLYRKKICNPLDISQTLRLLNTSLVSSNVPHCFFYNERCLKRTKIESPLDFVINELYCMWSYYDWVVVVVVRQ